MKKFAIAACIACIAVVLIGGGFVYTTATSYLNMDINPSVELSVNILDIVIDTKAFNEDGEAILAGLDVKGLHVDEAVKCIVDAAADQGYIEKDGSSIILLTTVTDDEKQAEQLTADAQAGALKALDENQSKAEVSFASINEARRAAALEAGISPGKMNLIQMLLEAQNPDDTISAEEYSFYLAQGDGQTNWVDAPVKDIMKAIKAARGEDKSGIANFNSAVVNGNSTANNDEDKLDEGKVKSLEQQLIPGIGDSDDDLHQVEKKQKETFQLTTKKK